MDEALQIGDAAAPAVPAQNGRPPLPPGYQRADTPYWLGYSRLRLDAAESRRHQQREARLWLLRRTEKLSPMERTRSKQEAEMEMCVVCLTNRREALSISCGHKVMCPDCAAKVKMINSSCPFCRVAMREVVLSKQKSPAEITGGAAGAQTVRTETEDDAVQNPAAGVVSDGDAERIAAIALPSGEQLSTEPVAEMMVGEPEAEVEMGEAPPVEAQHPDAAEMAAAAAEARQSVSAVVEPEHDSEGSGDL